MTYRLQKDSYNGKLRVIKVIEGTNLVLTAQARLLNNHYVLSYQRGQKGDRVDVAVKDKIPNTVIETMDSELEEIIRDAMSVVKEKPNPRNFEN